jgi:dipeptidyl aminopeptidase/acylaminoacyl peptidase
MDIYVKPVSGGAPVAVVDGPSTDMVLGWMETGDLLFYSDRDLTEGVWRLPMRAGRASGDPVQVAGDLWGMEAIGLAGDMLLFGVQTETPRLHTVPLDLGRNRLLGSPVPVEQEVRPSRSPSWSLDGEKLMYWASVREPGGQGGRLVVRSTAGGGSIDVTPRDLQIRGRPRWSRDGRSVRVLGRQLDGSDEGLYSYNLEDGSSRLLFSLPPGFVRRMEFTGDGPAVYAPGREADGSGVVVRFDLDSGDRVPLLTRPPRTDAAAPILGMGLSPDGETLALWESSDPAGAQILRLVPTSGGEGTVLLEIAFGDDVVKPRCEGARVPLWTPDGDHVLTVLRNLPADEPIPEHPCRLFKIPIDGGEPEFVGSLPEFSGEWALSPDGRRLAIGSGDNRGEIWMLHGVSGTY